MLRAVVAQAWQGGIGEPVTALFAVACQVLTETLSARLEMLRCGTVTPRNADKRFMTAGEVRMLLCTNSSLQQGLSAAAPRAYSEPAAPGRRAWGRSKWP